MSTEEFEALRAFVREKAGWDFAADAKTTVEMRLGRFRGKANHPVHNQGALLLDALTVQETYFFREEAAIGGFLKAARELWVPSRPLRLWSAACATGQEPYTLAISALENGLPVEIHASDISLTALEKAKSGQYLPFEVGRGMAENRLNTFFEKDDTHWRIQPRAKNLVQFFQHNLLHPPPTHLPLMDILFCRNVLYYFSAAKREAALQHLARQLRPGGYLVLSATENLWRLEDWFLPVDMGGVTFYQRTTNQMQQTVE